MAETLTKKLARRNLLTDRFGTICTILGVALGTATVNVVVVLDLNTRYTESSDWTTNPDLAVAQNLTVALKGFDAQGRPTVAEDAKEETHEDYQVMRSAIRLGSLSAFLVGALIVFFTFGVVVERRKRELALLRSLGASARQLARIFVREAVLIGLIGATLGFLASPILSYMAAFAGISTTGRAELRWLWFPWKTMLFVSALGAGTALLGIVRPALDVLRLDVPETLRPRFLETTHHEAQKRASGITLITLPFMALLYVLMRPFFRELLPSLAFFVLEAGLVCFAFLLMLIAVPEIVRRLGSAVIRALPKGPAAARLLTQRRIEQMGHEMAWSVSGVMLVFALLLALHISTHALKNEVVDWAARAIRPYAYVYSRGQRRLPVEVREALPEEAVKVQFTTRTPWPNPVYAVRPFELVKFAQTTGDPRLAEIAQRLGPRTTIISTMMARRFGLEEGGFLEVGQPPRRLKVVAVTDDVGYMPMIGPYRNSKTYAIIHPVDIDLIARHASQLGGAIAMAWPADYSGPGWKERLSSLPRRRAYRTEIGRDFERDRIAATDQDFMIFDLILLLTTLLAAVGIANNMVLSIHGRRRELALYRVLGMTKPQLRQMFLLEGLFVGALGGALAVLLGVPLGYASIGALRVVSAFDVGFELPPSYMIFTLIGAIAVSVFSALYPARQATSTSSAESIHYE